MYTFLCIKPYESKVKLIATRLVLDAGPMPLISEIL